MTDNPSELETSGAPLDLDDLLRKRAAAATWSDFYDEYGADVFVFLPDLFAKISELETENARLKTGSTDQWRCFHCDEVFDNVSCAAEHFGLNENSNPGCIEKVIGGENGLLRRVRSLEGELAQSLFDASNETGAVENYVHGLRADHASELLREEERGYAKGVSDMRAELIAAEASLAASQERVAELEALIDTPMTNDWFEAVRVEAAHQIERWGTDHDAGKTPLDWFWLIGFLSQKAATSQIACDPFKAMHHTISTGAALLNWHRSLTGENNRMRPGVEDPDSAVLC